MKKFGWKCRKSYFSENGGNCLPEQGKQKCPWVLHVQPNKHKVKHDSTAKNCITVGFFNPLSVT